MATLPAGSHMYQEQPCAIHRLPNEVLLEIFRHTQNEVKRMKRSPHATVKCAPWYDLLRVCKHWSTVARASPVLWRDIDLWSHLDTTLLRYSLAFSGEMPVDVRISWPVKRLTSVTDLLAPHAHRIRSLKLRELNIVTDFSLTLFLYHYMPSLEELVLQWDYEGHDGAENLSPLNPNQQEDEEGDPIRYPFFWFPKAEQFPRLLDMSLQRTVGFSLRFPAFATLRRLELSYCIVLGDISLAAFLTWLAQHPALEELSLIRVQFSLTIERSLRLPSTLRKFTLEDFPTYISHFLSHMAPLPADLNIHVIRRRRYLPPHSMPETPVTAVYSLPRDRAVLPILSLVQSITVRMRHWEVYNLVGRTSIGTVVGITAWLPEEPPEVVDFLGDLRSAFAGAPVSELRVEGHGENLLTEARWQSALLAFPNLRRIAITDTTVDDEDGEDACRNLLKALRAPVPHAPDEIMCPGLVALQLVTEDSDRDAELLEALAATQTARTARGAPLDEIAILLKPVEAFRGTRLSEAELLQRRAVYTQVLQSSVRILSIEEWRDASDPSGDDLDKVW
ncbi:hypothetical protein C8T65DRAFT_208717 [Cerioporus squamosus]|nr:hypothetical protein C8T65DRAFT_208717 [Cerioporus squamosus]